MTAGLRGVVAEGLGTALLLYVIVGSGVAAETLSDDGAVRLLAHALVVGLGLGALIVMFQPVSGSHLNPSVTLALWRTGEVGGGQAGGYVAAQLMGAVLGVVLANVTFGRAPIAISETTRSGLGVVTAEAVATFVLVLVILALVRTERPAFIPAAVAAWVVTIVFATSSTGFANPAVTIARALTDGYTGIAPVSIPAFLAAQVVAGLAAAAAAVALIPSRSRMPTATT